MKSKNKFFLVFLILVIVAVLFTLGIKSLFQETSCSEYSQEFEQDEFNIVFDKAGRYYSFSITGTHPESQEKVKFQSNDYTWLVYSLKESLNKGDTLLKIKGKAELELHKKDSIIYYSYVCHENNESELIVKSLPR